MVHISLLAYPGCATSSITGMIDALSIANRWNSVSSEFTKAGGDEASPLFHCDIVSADGGPIAGDNRVAILPHASIDDVTETSVIIIPGFISSHDYIRELPGHLISWLKAWHEEGALIAATCTGSFLLAETGLLNGRLATTNWLFARAFKRRYPKVALKPERLLTEDNRLLCTGATSACIDLCLHLIRRFGSDDLAAICAKGLLFESARISQAPFFIFDYFKGHSDAPVLKAQRLMEEQYATPFSVEGLASDLGISTRHFVRRFKQATGDTPLTYLQRIRIEAAKQALEKTTEPIDSITRHVGYEDTNSFRKLFKKSTGLSPKEYRARFGRWLNKN